MTLHQHTVRDTRTLHLVTALVDAGLVVPDRRPEAERVVDGVLAGQATPAAPMRRRLAELAGYVGGAFVVAAAAIFLGVQWGSLSVGEQVGLLVGIAAVLAVVGGAVVGTAAGGAAAVREGADPVRRRLAGALLTAAAGSAAGALGVLVEETGTGSEQLGVAVAFGALAVLSMVGYAVAPTIVGQLGIALGAAPVTPVALDVVGGSSTVSPGLWILALGVVWLVATERDLWREVASARVIGCGLTVVGAQVLVFDSGDLRWVGYLALAVVAAASFGAYVVRPAWPYLAAGVVAVTLLVPEALLDWTDNDLGPAGVMLVTGVTLLGSSLVGFRLRRDVAAGG
ncbi:MAG TPA: hypothetical protein VER39_08810 [Nocardioidaceae bacterium]|nr:hypothetical protein [Nocardioidaceae bacterium]